MGDALQTDGATKLRSQGPAYSALLICSINTLGMQIRKGLYASLELV